jgi:hypothetical protein
MLIHRIQSPRSHSSKVAGIKRKAIPLICPIHRKVQHNEWWCKVEYLTIKSAPGIEDGVSQGASEGSLTIRRKGVGRDALLGL